MISHAFLQGYWWTIISLLAGLLVFLMFVQGGQSFIFSLPSNDTQRKLIVNTLGRKWEFTFTTLVTFGGVFFASFPLFYATSFGGAYLLWMTILFSFIIQAVAYEYRSKPANIYGSRTYDIFLFLNGSLGPFLIGIAVATFFTGSEFSLDPMKRVQWHSPWHGLESLADIRNLAAGFTILFLARVNGLLFIIGTVGDDDINLKARKRVIMNSLFFLVFFLYFTFSMLTMKGYAVNPADSTITLVNYKYLYNFFRMPLILCFFVCGVAGVIFGIYITLFRNSNRGIWFSGSGTVLVFFTMLLTAGFNNTSFYPSSYDIKSSLTVYNASSSQFTLKTMMYVSFIIPFVIAYIWYAWKSITDRKITAGEMEKGEHTY